MNDREALKHIKATIGAFGPDEGIELDQKAWSKLHSAIKEALAQPEHEPVACPFPCGWKAMLSIIIKDGAFLARGLIEGEPVTGHQREIVMRLIDYAKTMASHGLSAPPQREEGCAECGKKASDGWALYCVKCSAPVREWVGLTDEEVVNRANAEVFAEAFARGVAWAELKLKEKNT